MKIRTRMETKVYISVLAVCLSLLTFTLVFADKAAITENGLVLLKDDGTWIATEANLPLDGPTAMKNIDKAMGMMMGGPEDMKMMQEMIMKRHAEVLAKGEKLFNDPKLGGASKGISCASCHPQGGTTGGKAEIPKMHGYGPFQIPIPSLIGAAASFPKFKAPNADIITISQMNNNCTAMFVGGKRLSLNGEESHALTLYVTNLSKGIQIEPGKMGM